MTASSEVGAAGVVASMRHHPAGTVLIRFDEPAAATAIDVQTDGRILAGGKAGEGKRTHWVVVRYLPNGDLDPSFHPVTSSPGRSAVIAGLTVQPDGRIVVVGDTARHARKSRLDFLIARYLPDGTLDPSFGRRGYVRTDFGASDTATEVEVERDGDLVVAGNSADRHRVGPIDFAVARYRADGRLDRSFGRDGRQRAAFGGISLVQAIRVMRDGGIELAGISGNRTLNNVALARFTRGGVPDPAFGENGKLVVSSLPDDPTPAGITFSQPAMAFVGKGDLITAEEAVDAGRDFAYGIDTARFLPNGARDPSYGSGGRALIRGAGDFVGGVAADRQGRVAILMDGIAGRQAGPLLTRLAPSGALDRRFGRGGHARAKFGPHADNLSEDIAIGPSGDIYVAGVYSKELISSTGIFAVTSFDPNGRLRRGFG